MSAASKKATLSLPLRIIFTQEGSSQFINKRTKLKRMRLADNTEEFGIETSTISPSLLQRMFLADYFCFENLAYDKLIHLLVKNAINGQL